MLTQKRTGFPPATLYPRQNQAGFSLPEVLIVIAIIGILAAIAFPSFLHWLPNIRLKAAARDVYSNLQQTKIQAIKQNKDWAIVFDTVSGRYYICSDPGVDADWTTVSGSNTIEKTVYLADYKSGVTFGHGNANKTMPEDPLASIPADNVSYNPPNNVVVFDPRGLCNVGFVYLDHEKDSDAMAVGTLTSGIIKISRWKGTDWE